MPNTRRVWVCALALVLGEQRKPPSLTSLPTGGETDGNPHRRDHFPPFWRYFRLNPLGVVVTLQLHLAARVTVTYALTGETT